MDTIAYTRDLALAVGRNSSRKSAFTFDAKWGATTVSEQRRSPDFVTRSPQSPDMHAATCTRSRPRWRSKISTRSADDNTLDVMALPRWPSLQPLDRCPHAEVGFYDGARTGPNSVVLRMFTMSQLHLNEQTSTETTRWSHQCQLRTHAQQQHACYSITSSARASTVGGSSKPIAFAVLRLMTSSYLFGACTGSSAGFSPLRMRSTYPAARRY